MIESLNLSWPDFGQAMILLGRVASLCVLSLIFARQRRAHRFTRAQLDLLITATRRRRDAGRRAPEPEAVCEIVKLEERRK
jgi:hypothetical protein